MPGSPDTRDGAPSVERVLASAALVVQSPVFWAPLTVTALAIAVAGPEDGPAWLLAMVLAPVTAGAAAGTGALYRRHPYLGQLTLLALTVLLLLVLLFLGGSPIGIPLPDDAASSVSNAPGP